MGVVALVVLFIGFVVYLYKKFNKEITKIDNEETLGV
jgi:cbb3-type cytochrome oxidase subunit 3